MVNPKKNTEKLAIKVGFIQKRRTGYGKIARITLTDIQDWLRDEHRIHCTPSPWKDETIMDGEIYEGNVIDVNDDWNTSVINSFFNDYYQCLESCIIFGLKILKERHAEKN